MSLLRVLSVWVLLALAMSANGVLREAILEPALGARSADVLSAALGVALILLVTAFGFRPLAGAPTRRLVAASLLLVAITVTFEVALGRFVEHRTWAELLGDYAIWRGQLWPVVLLTLAITPFLWGRSAAAAPGEAGLGGTASRAPIDLVATSSMRMPNGMLPTCQGSSGSGDARQIGRFTPLPTATTASPNGRPAQDWPGRPNNGRAGDGRTHGRAKAGEGPPAGRWHPHPVNALPPAPARDPIPGA